MVCVTLPEFTVTRNVSGDMTTVITSIKLPHYPNGLL